MFTNRRYIRREVERQKILAYRKLRRIAKLDSVAPKKPKKKRKPVLETMAKALRFKTKDPFNKNKGGRPRLKKGEHSLIVSFSVSESEKKEFDADRAFLNMAASEFFRFLYSFWKAKRV